MPHYLLQNNLQQLDTWWEKQSVSLVKRGTSLARLTCLQKKRKVVLHKKIEDLKNSIECLQKCWIQWGEGDINNLNNNFRQSLKDDVSWCLPWGRRKNTVTYFKGVTPFPHPIVRNVFAKKWWNCGITPTPPIHRGVTWTAFAIIAMFFQFDSLLITSSNEYNEVWGVGRSFCFVFG